MITTRPSGLNAAESTKAGWANGGPTAVPSAAFQSRAERSSLPVSRVLPSGLNATQRTAPWVPHHLVQGLALGDVPELCTRLGPDQQRFIVGAELHTENHPFYG